MIMQGSGPRIGGDITLEQISTCWEILRTNPLNERWPFGHPEGIKRPPLTYQAASADQRLSLHGHLLAVEFLTVQTT